MLSRFRRWWVGRSRIERLLVGIGVPVAAIAALWGARQDRATAAAEGQDEEGGPGDVATFTTAPNVLNTGAPGVDTGQLSSFTEAFTGEIGAIEERLEVEFGQSATERAQAAAEHQAAIGVLEERFEGVERAAEAAGRKADKARQEAQQRAAPAPAAADPLASFRSAVLGAYQAEGVRPPNPPTVNRIALDFRDGKRTVAQLRRSIRINEANQGRKTVAASRAFHGV